MVHTLQSTLDSERARFYPHIYILTRLSAHPSTETNHRSEFNRFRNRCINCVQIDFFGGSKWGLPITTELKPNIVARLCVHFFGNFPWHNKLPSADTVVYIVVSILSL